MGDGKLTFYHPHTVTGKLTFSDYGEIEGPTGPQYKVRIAGVWVNANAKILIGNTWVNVTTKIRKAGVWD